MYGGIDQLVDTYKGNPQPLQKQVQEAQQKQPPGKVPPDLEEALALQEIAELRQGAQNQQAMQAGGAQSSVVDKLKQMLGGVQAQAQMAQGAPAQQAPQGRPMMQGPQGRPMMQAPQGRPMMQAPQRPVMAARGGSIAQLMSNLGRHYAGGGIIAFNGEEDSDVKDEGGLTPEEAKEILRRLKQRTDMRPEKMDVTDIDFTSIPGFVAGNRFQQELDKVNRKPPTLTAQQMEALVKPAPREEPPREPYSGPQQNTLQEQGAAWVARKQAAREAKAREEAESDSRRAGLISQIPTGGQKAPESTGRMPGEVERNITNTMAALPGASVAKGSAGGLRGLLGLLSGASDRKEKQAEEPEEKPKAKPSPTDPNFRRQTDPRMLGVPATPPDEPRTAPAPTASAPRPTAASAEAGAPAAVASKLDPNSLRGLTEDYIRGEFKLSPEAERDKAVEWSKKTMGLDALLAEKERRASDREAMIKEIQGNRTPTWIKAFQSAGKADPREGIGGLLATVGGANVSAREAYENQDLKYQAELAQLRDVITDAKISGNKELVKEGMAAYKEVDARRRAAATNATSLVKTDEDKEMRKQLARDAAAGRKQTADLALEEKKRQFNENQQRLIREKDVERANKIEAAISKRAGMIDMQLQNPKIKPEDEAALLAKRNAIVKQVMREYPSVKPEKPTESQFLAAARAANPGVSDAELKAYYKQTYGT
jgi:hypothetical protein